MDRGVEFHVENLHVVCNICIWSWKALLHFLPSCLSEQRSLRRAYPICKSVFAVHWRSSVQLCSFNGAACYYLLQLLQLFLWTWICEHLVCEEKDLIIIAWGEVCRLSWCVEQQYCVYRTMTVCKMKVHLRYILLDMNSVLLMWICGLYKSCCLWYIDGRVWCCVKWTCWTHAAYPETFLHLWTMASKVLWCSFLTLSFF